MRNYANLYCVLIRFGTGSLSQANVLGAALLMFDLGRDQFEHMAPIELQKIWRALMKRSHPDLPQNRDNGIDPGAINAAYDVLKRVHAEIHASGAGTGRQSRQGDPRDWIAPPWQPDKKAVNNKIFVESYRDQNFIKKQLWEMSGKSEKIYTIDAFGVDSLLKKDAFYSFQGRTKVYGSPDVFDEMAKAMIIWNANGGKPELTRAVLVAQQVKPNPLYLIYSDGRSHGHRPIPLKFNPEADSHYTDKDFQKNLPAILDSVKRLFEAVA